MFERKRTPDLRRRRAELAATTATSRDLANAKCRSMSDNRDLLDRRLHVLRDLDYPGQGWIAVDDASKQIREHALDLAVNQVINVEFVEAVSLLQLPCAWTTNDNCRPELPDYGMRDDLDELVRIYRHQVFAGKF